MKNILKKILLIFIIVFISWLFYQNWSKKESVMSGKTNVVTLNFEDINQKVYLKAKVWGVSGNHKEIVLSEKRSDVTDNNTDYVFYTSEIYYKIESNGNLIIYAPESSISEPTEKINGIRVILKGLRHADEINKYKENYRKYGLEKISVYQE